MEPDRDRLFDGRPSGWSAAPSGYDTVVFGPFQFSRARQILMLNGESVPLGGRALSILNALVERPGELVTKEELLAVAWPSTHVEEGNLRVQIANLRRALGDNSSRPKSIVNVSGRGYRFIASVQQLDSSPDLVLETPVAPARDNLPETNAQFFGREAEMELLAGLVEQARLVTIAGTGGIGKTTVAIALAHSLKHQFQGAAYFVDLAAVSDPAVVPFAIASATRIAIDTQRSVESLVNGLRADHALLVFDNCEHLIDAVALVAESLLKSAPQIRIVATSHEPLRTEGERVYRIKPFDLPKGVETLPLDAALQFPAIRLFVQHMMENDDRFALGDADVPFIVEICRRLDGLPLAIEIAASRAAALGIAELVDRLDDRFGILTTGRRTVATRHQTLRNMLDWSHDNLGDREKAVLRRLAVFSGSFTLEAAATVAADERLNPATVTDSVASLVRKSLLMGGSQDGKSTFRLLDSTRLYALEKLGDAGEERRVRHLHLHNLCDVLRQAEADWQMTPARTWGKTYSRHLDDIRASLSWAFGPAGSDQGGILLTSLALPLAMQLGLHDEFRARMNTAKERAAAQSPTMLVPELRIQLATNSLGYNVGQTIDLSLSRAIELAELTGSDRHRMEPLVQLSSAHISVGLYEVAAAKGELALDFARRSGDGLAVLSASRAMAQAAHYAGRHVQAMALAQTVLRHAAVNIPYTYGFMHSDRRVTMRWTLVRALWMSGRGDEAVQVAEDGIAVAEDAGVMALAQFLGMAVIPMYLWRGDDAAAGHLTARLREHSDRYSFKYWKAWCGLFDEVMAYRSAGQPVSLPRGALESQTLSTLVGLAAPLPKIASTDDWSAPELMRLSGEMLLAQGDVAGSESEMLAALDLSRQHGALAWELRCATSLARLWQMVQRHSEAASLLTDVLDRLPRSTVEIDQLQARALLDTLT